MMPINSVWYMIYCLATLSFQEAAASGYKGALVGALSEKAHDVSGTVYVADQKTIIIEKFNFDGNAPDAAFWMKLKNSPNPESEDKQGLYVPYNGEKYYKVDGPFTDMDVILMLSDDEPEHTVDNLRLLYMWCNVADVSFGGVVFQDDQKIPGNVDLGHLVTRKYAASGKVHVLNTMEIRITNFTFRPTEGNAATTYFSVGTGEPDENGVKIYYDGSLQEVTKAEGSTVNLKLPYGLSLHDYDYLSLYSFADVESLADIAIPDATDLLVPPQHLMEAAARPYSCEKMNDYFHIGWEMEDSHIIIHFITSFDQDERYVAFGVSGDENVHKMIGADVIVVYLPPTGAVATDYYLTAYSQCSNGQGACPDDQAGGVNNVELIGAQTLDGIATVIVKRPLAASDEGDKAIDQSASTQVVWSSGLINVGINLATKHSEVITESKTINFGRTVADNCNGKPQLRSKPAADNVWTIPPIWGTESKTEFTVRMGQSGGEKGQTSITGFSGWGIAYFVDEKLIPEIYLQRGRKYTFIVETGNNPDNPAKLHPFYITDDEKGGYAKKNDEEKQAVTNYAGVDSNGAYTAAGRYCEYKHKTTDQSDESATYEDFFQTLELECEDGEAATLEFTPDSSMPDLLYYHCHTHNHMGWKLHIRDDITKEPGFNTATTTQRIVEDGAGNLGENNHASAVFASYRFLLYVITFSHIVCYAFTHN